MDPRNSYTSLVKDIRSLDVTGDFDPCELLLTGDKAFPILVSTTGKVTIAASHYGKGRLVVTAHEAMLRYPQFLQFLKNSLEWLKPSTTAQVGVHQSLNALPELLLRNGVKVHPEAVLGSSLGVYCMDAYDDTQADAVVQFVKRGGGLLIGGQAWHWSCQHGKEKVLAGFPGNRMTSVAGVYFTSNVGDKGAFPVPPNMPRAPLLTDHGLNIQGDLKTLLNGVSEFNMPNMTPSHLLIHGNLAFPIGVTRSFQSFAGAAYYGRGRVVVTSHEAMLGAPSMKTFLLNAIHWLTAGNPRKVGVGSNLEGLYSILDQAKVSCELTSLKEGLSVYCCTAYRDTEKEKIHEFVSEGGGLLIGGQSWHWSQTNPNGNPIAEYQGNKILNKFGIGITAEYINISGESYPAGRDSDIAEGYGFRKALFHFKEHILKNKALKEPQSSWMKRLAQDLATFLNIPAGNAPPFSSVQETMLEVLKSTGIPEVRPQKKVKSNSKEACLLSLAWGLYNAVPGVQDLVPSLYPSYPSYPAAPPQIIRINGRNEGDRAWRSTGLYAPPAKTVALLFPSTAVHKKLQVQVGCQADDLRKADELLRPPLMTRCFEVIAERMDVSSLWGGLLYIVVPKKSSLGYLSVTVEGASEAPYFKLGESSVSTWKSTTRYHPAPFAELETENLILTVPSSSVREMDNPEVLLKVWTEIMKAMATLASISSSFPRPERIVEDVQIANGWMHAGYPIMSNVEAIDDVLDVQQMHTKGTWGPIHELGHNQQRSGWNFPPHTTEATCNLWSVYINETVLSIPRERAHGELQPDVRRRRIEEYIRKGAQLQHFEVFTALEPYLQLQEAFGWEPYPRLFAKYQTLTQIPEDNQSKMNLWAELFSEHVKRDLAPFFKAWGWPIEDALSQRLSKAFPAWKEDPMKKYQ